MGTEALVVSSTPGTGKKMLGRVAESSSAALADAGAEIGAPQLGHAIAVPGARAVRRPQTAHTISCIELLQWMTVEGAPSSIAYMYRNAIAWLVPSSEMRWRALDSGGVTRRYFVFFGPITL